MNLAPIVLFVYNRPWHTQQTIESLQKNELAEQCHLFVYSDAPQNDKTDLKVQAVRDYLKNITGFKSIKVVECTVNLGLAKSIISGVTEVINEYGRIIVLEDDIVTSPVFLQYMNEALDFYESEERIGSITGFNFHTDFTKFDNSFDVFPNIRPMSWSWATWSNRWNVVDWEIDDYPTVKNNKEIMKKFAAGGTDLPKMLELQMNNRIDSWYVRFCYNLILRDKYTIYPRISYVNNLGHDGTGVHCGTAGNSIFSHNQLNFQPSKFTSELTLDCAKVVAFNRGFNKKFDWHKVLIRKLLGDAFYGELKKIVKMSFNALAKEKHY